jgi:hypothetical protein
VSHASGLRGALDALTGRRPAGARPAPRAAGRSPGTPSPTLDHQRDTLAQALYRSDQGFWSSGRDDESPHGTAWSTSTERYLRGKYLDQADVILAAGFRLCPTLTRQEVEEAHLREGSISDPDDWIVVAWALGIEVDESG